MDSTGAGLDFHTGGTLAKEYFVLRTAVFGQHGSVPLRIGLGAPRQSVREQSWINIKLGKFELDNLLSEKRILTLTNVAGVYANYHFHL
jgi:hypothetical protein